MSEFKSLNQMIKLFALLLVMMFPCSGFAEAAGPARITRLHDFLALGTGATTGTYYPLGSAFANVWSTRLEKVSVMAHSTKGSVENIRFLRRRELNLAIAQSDIVLAAIKGTGSFSGQPYPDLRVLTALFPEVVQIVVRSDSDIQSLAQLRSHKVVVGARGSGNALTSLALLAAAGIGEDEIAAVYLSYDESIQAMEKGECDAAIIIAGVPTRAIQELAQRVPIRILGFNENEISRMTGALPYLSKVAIEPGVYSGQSRVDTLALMALLIADNRLSQDLARRLLQTVFSNLDYLKKVHERAADISPSNYLKGVPDGFLHPGAENFFRQLIPEN